MTVRHARDAAVVIALMVLAIAVHATALSGFWLYDDPIVLVEAIRQPAQALLFDPGEYQHLSTLSFTPIVLLSFKLDFQLHGIDPRVFYVDQLLSLIAATLLFYFVLRRYVPDIYAALGSAIFVTSWAAIYAARTLMIRHYVDGLVFALAAILVWRRSKTLASVLYLLAMLCKEVYAPIPLFFICDSRFQGRRWRDIAREIIGPSIAAIAFLVWRSQMTGSSTELTPSSKLATLPLSLWVHLTGPGAPVWSQAVWGFVMVVALALFVWRFRIRAIAFLAASLAVMLLPILTLASNFEWRYSFAFVAFLIGVMTIAAGTSQQRWTIAILVALLITTAITSIRQRTYYETLTRNGIEQEGRYVWTQPKSAPALASRTSPAWYLDGLAWLRKRESGSDAPRTVFSPYAITVGGLDPSKIVAIDDGRVVPISRTRMYGGPDQWQAERAHFDPKAPLTIEFALRNHDAVWRLGPPAARFVFLTDPGYSAIPILANGKQRVPAAREPQFFRIVREEKDGRWTVSPTLPVPAEGKVTLWKR